METDTGCPGSQRTRLLVVSPDENDSLSVRTLVTTGDWTIVRAAGLADAIQSAHADDPDVVLAERQLSDGTWTDLLEFFNSRDNPPPLIVLSRFVDDRLWVEVLNLGGFDVLAKPLERSEASRVLAMARLRGRMHRGGDQARASATGV